MSGAHPTLLKDLTSEQRIRVLAMDFVLSIIDDVDDGLIVPTMAEVAAFLETGAVKSAKVHEFPKEVIE